MTQLWNPLKTAAGVLVISLACASQFGCSRSAQHYLDRGNQFLADAKYDDANLQYRKALTKEPKSAEGHYRLALLEIKQGQLSNGFQEMRQAVQLQPDNAEYRIQLADLALTLYDSNRQSTLVYDQIAQSADYLLKKDPKSFDGLRYRGDLLAIDGKLNEARAALDEANALKPFDPRLAVTYVQVLFRLNDGPAAEAFAKKCMQQNLPAPALFDLLADYYIRSARLPEAENVLQSKTAKLPHDADALLRLSAFYQRYKREAEMSATLQKILDNSKDFPRGQILVGDFYLQAGRPQDAIRTYSAGRGAHPGDDLIYRKKIAKVLVGQGKHDAALAELEQVVTANPKDADGRFARALLLRDSDNPKSLETAIAELNDLAANAPKDAAIRFNLGVAYRIKGDEKSARAQLSESAQAAPGYVAPRLVLAEMAQHAQDYSQAIRMADEVLALDPANVEAKLLRVSGFIGTNSLVQARSELNTLLQQVPNSLVANLNMAVLDTVEKKYADAERRYRRMYQPNAADLRPLEGLLQLYIAQNQPDKAIQLALAEVKQNPDSQARHLLLASFAARAGKLDLALEQFEWLQAKDPQKVEPYVAIGQVLRLKGDLAGALDSYRKAQALAPANAAIVGTVGLLESSIGKPQDAVASLKKQLALDPADAIAMNNLAYALADQGTDLDRAQALAEAARRKLPGNAGVAETLGWVYTKKGLNSSAIQIFNGLIKKYPEDASLHYHLGVALLQSGKSAEAKAELSISLSKKPAKDDEEKIKQIMSKLS